MSNNQNSNLDKPANINHSDSLVSHTEDDIQEKINDSITEECSIDNEDEDDEYEDEEGESDDQSDNDETDEDDDSESDQENQRNDNETFEKINPPLSPNSIPTCYICLNEFEGQDVGSPDSCENIHYFCLECIEEWSKQINTCPVDRKSFSFIFVRRDVNTEVIMKVPIMKNSVVEIETMEDDLTYCEICGRCDREDRLLLCDGCDFGYHCECLDPPLETIPVDEWFCPECFERLFGDDVRQETYRRNSQRRAIARTGASEMVRNRILARRTIRNQNTSVTRKSKPKRTRRKKRKTKKSTTKTGKNKKVSRKRKKRTKKSKMSTKRLPSAKTRSRIASKLGITCKAKSLFPVMKSINNNRSISEVRYSAGISNLSMFGYELELNNPRSYDDEYEFETSFGGVGLIARPRHHISPTVSKSIQSPEPLSDLLSEIMTSQEILHASSSDLTIARDGRIYLNAENKSAIRKCPDSNSQSSNSSPTNKDSSNNSYSNKVSFSEVNADSLSDNDISLIKPSPVVALPDDKPDIELYSDIESVGDHKEDEDGDNSSNKKEEKEINNQCDKEPSNSENDFSKTVNSKSELDTNQNDLVKAARAAKRRPSIKDLFGGDSEEEEDEDLKRLVAQKGSINVHYPLKMPIVLKTNFLKDNGASKDDDVPISKKWIPIYPETEKVKNSGPKWKAIGETSKKDEAKSDRNEKDNTKVEYSNKLSKDNVGSLLNSDQKVIEDHNSNEKNLKESSYDVSKNVKLSESATIKEEKTNSKVNPDKKKVRVCKHGRVINKDKETEKKRLIHDEGIENNGGIKKLKGEQDEVKKDVIDKDENESDLNWKKPSSSKYRNYRDGKIKNDELLYKDCQLMTVDSLKKTSDKKSKKDDSRKKNSKSEREHHHHRHHHQYRNTEESKSKEPHKSSSSKSSYGLHSNAKTESDESKTNSGNKDKHACTSKTSSSRDKEARSLSSKESKSVKHHSHHHHHHHRHHKHSNETKHHHSSKSAHSDKTKHKNDCHHKATTSTSSDKKVTSKTNTYETYPVIKTLDSKEIYTEGDKIIINVNFKKEENGKEINNSSLKSISNKPSECAKSNTTERNDNNVEILSPQYGENSYIKSDNSIASPNSDEYSNSRTNLNSFSLSDNLKEVLSEEFKFLPRILQNKETNVTHTISHGPRTPDLYIDDSFLPTPTQDESQSPILNRITKQSKVSSIQSTSPIETKDDFYDPELPLQSPDRDSIKSPTKDILFDSVASPKVSPNDKNDGVNLSNKSSTSSLTSTVAAAAATLASLNSINLSQLIQIAQTMKNQNILNNKIAQTNKQSISSESNKDIIEIVDMDVDSPSPPSPQNSRSNNTYSASLSNVKEIWDQIVKTASARLNSNNNNSKSFCIKNGNQENDSKKHGQKMDRYMEEQPTSAVDMENKEKYIKKLNRQERVVEEVKLALKPHYQKKRINKDEYKEILRKAVPKICHSKSGEINPLKIQKLVEGYIKRFRYMRKKQSTT